MQSDVEIFDFLWSRWDFSVIALYLLVLKVFSFFKFGKVFFGWSVVNSNGRVIEKGFFKKIFLYDCQPPRFQPHHNQLIVPSTMQIEYCVKHFDEPTLIKTPCCKISIKTKKQRKSFTINMVVFACITRVPKKSLASKGHETQYYT